MEIAIEQLKVFSPEITQAVNNLLKQLNPNSKLLSDEEVVKIIEGPSNYFFVARESDNNKIVGMLTLISINAISGKKGLFEDIVVDKNYRKKGIAAKLIAEAISHARKEGIGHIDFTSNPKKVEANNLYQSLGLKKRDTNVYRIDL